MLHVTGSYDLNMTEYGLKPPTLMFGRIKVGQTVSWLNLGQQTHSVVLNQGDPQPVWWMPLATSVIPLDSGGIGPSQSYSFTFQTVGTFPYHDSTTPLYNHADRIRRALRRVRHLGWNEKRLALTDNVIDDAVAFADPHLDVAFKLVEVLFGIH